MNILFLGINHYDLLGAKKIKAHLRMFKQNGATFDCICIEWDKEIATTLIKSREKFRDCIIQKHLDNIAPTTIDLIVQALAYEADSFRQVFDLEQVVWLDKGKVLESIDNYFEGLLTVYTWNCRHYSIDINDVDRLTEHLWDISMDPEELGTDPNRDGNLKLGIEEAINCGYENILVIIGAKHANLKRSRSTACLLVEAGYAVESIILAPTPRTVDPNTHSTDV